MKLLRAIAGLAMITTTLASNASELSGNVSFGWRDVSVDGANNKYRQHVNLSDGARLLGLRFDFKPRDSEGRLPDRILIEATNLGGDPFETIDLSVRKYGTYDFRYRHRKSTYSYDDLLVDPANASVEGSTGGDFHRFDYVREQDSIDLDLQFTPRATGSLAFNRYTKKGQGTTTRDIQRDEFEFDQTIDEVDQSNKVGFQYRWDRTTLSVEQSFHEYDNEGELFLTGFSNGINTEDLAQLDFYFFDQPYGYNGNETQLNFINQLSDRLEWRFGWRLLDLDLDFNGIENAQGVDFLGNPFATDTSRSGEVNRETQIYSLDGSFALSDSLNIIAAIDHRQFDQNGRLDFALEDSASAWDIEVATLDLGFEYALSPRITITAGWTAERREVDKVDESASTLAASTVDTDRDEFFTTIDYRLSGRMHISAAIEKNSVDDPYTLASPTDSVRYRLRGQYKFDSGLSVTATHKIRDYDNDNTGWSRKDEQTDLQLNYDAKRLHISAGVSYVDLTRNYQRLVVGGTRQDLFSAAYLSDTTFLNGRIVYTVTDALTFGAKLWVYDSNGSFKVDNRDLSTFVEYELPRNYSIHASYRNIDYEEDLEQYDVDIVEFGVRLRW